MRVSAVLIIYAISSTTAFAPSSPSARSTSGTALCLFDSIFKAKQTSGSANTSLKKELDGMTKKKKFSVLMISSSAKKCVKGGN
eukprot:CAMPEP_0201686374 /NCGR_PEP_ID=MMETSP0578-20130828/846_1 /ASSEMBLY_ACC=CAM_ASM_000663 /TAXON_ID=267565 /ORGANISM="Skeletonema grethea, Strain CCMP 1804" /LENGTH=83 /DNA_ID=CAMNT_0048170423 /DNA_START=78 /DNA_END=329 /DNA_ORIENTATION=-